MLCYGLISSYGMEREDSDFEVGKIYHVDSHKDIYLKYSTVINPVDVSKISSLCEGFEIFRAQETARIGFLTYCYDKKLSEFFNSIHIGAVWINPGMRCQGYASKALENFMSLCRLKKAYFSDAKYFSFFTMRDNAAMHRVAEKVGFDLTNPSNC